MADSTKILSGWTFKVLSLQDTCNKTRFCGTSHLKIEASRLCLVAGIFTLYLRYRFLLWVLIALLLSWVCSDGCRSSGVPHSGSSLHYPHRQPSHSGIAGTHVEGWAAGASGWKENEGGHDGQLTGKSPAPLGIPGSERMKQGSLRASPATATHWPGKEGSKLSPLLPQMKEPDMCDDEFSGSAPRAPFSGGLGCPGYGGDCQFPKCLS